jgi:hypothetical protein
MKYDLMFGPWPAHYIVVLPSLAGSGQETRLTALSGEALDKLLESPIVTAFQPQQIKILIEVHK